VVGEQAIAPITRTVEGIEWRFSSDALLEIYKANLLVDWHQYTKIVPHFTDERFIRASGRLKSIKEEILYYLTDDAPNGDVARDLLGQALH
jgi:hypothetical protein